MATAFRSGAVGLMQHLFTEGTCTGLSDARLLERFVDGGDESAFAALVSRHGPLVLNTCRAVLKDPDAAADAFQATFVLLFRKARSIRGSDAVGAWLHRVAYRTAIRARAAAARRREVERAAVGRRSSRNPEPDDRDAVLHEEIERLPERLRRPVVLCYLEGMTRDQVADHLRCTEGSIRGRLAKGRELLRQRLGRRGITLAVPPLARAAVPEGLVATTVRVATGPAGAVAASASRGGISVILKVAGVVAVGVGLAAALAGPIAPGGGHPGPTDRARPAISAADRPGRAIADQPSDRNATIPIEGRILDLQGRPVAAATVAVTYFDMPPVPGGKLDTWIDDFKLGKTHPVAHLLAEPNRWQKFAATTGPDGRFRIEGLPRDGIATVSIAGPGIETSEVSVLTRDMATIRVMSTAFVNARTRVCYGARFEHVAAPSQVIVGTVRDQDTGAPIAGVKITAGPDVGSSMFTTPGVEAITDAQGRYRLDGLPASRGCRLYTEAPGQPYVNCGFSSPGGGLKPGPFPFDIALKRGVLVRGRLTNKVTGKPLYSSICYQAFRDNPYLDEYPNFKRGSQDTRILSSSDDGRFTIPALPGRGIISARASEDGYLHGIGADAIKGLDPRFHHFPTYPSPTSTLDQHVLVEINPAPGTKEVNLELQADPGRSVAVTVVDPDGRPVVGGLLIYTLDVFQGPVFGPGESATFAVSGLPSAGPYRVDFIHHNRKLAGCLFLKGDEKGDLTVKLQPWGTVVGRIVDEERRPRIDVHFSRPVRDRPDPDRGDLPGRQEVDARGRFRIEGLVPGIRYDAHGNASGKAYGPVFEGVQLGPGEVKDLGDILLPTAGKKGD